MFAHQLKSQLQKVDPKHAAKRIFPIISWLPRYNRKWLLGDIIAGLTIGIMVVPQALAYASLASLPVQYGLYSSFLGVMIYCIFGTSKDITIGPSAIASLYVGVTLKSLAEKGHDPITAAISMAFLSGCFCLILGVFRLGIIMDLISSPVTLGFTSGAAITILVSQVPSLLGIKGVVVQGPIYTVLQSIFLALDKTRYEDAIVGFVSIGFLIGLKYISDKYGHVHPIVKGLGVGRNAVCVIVFTLIAYIMHVSFGQDRINLVGTIPTGLPKPAIPNLSPNIVSDLLSSSIVGGFVIILEHFAAARTYGRQNQYKVDSSQELISLGICNICNSFFSSYIVPGALSRTAVNSQSGVKTPLSGIVTGIIVILSLNFLPPLIYFVPKASLAAIIMTSIYSLIAGYKTYWNLWKIQATDMIAALLAFLVTLFTDIQTGIEVAVAFSLIISLHRIARPNWQMIGPVENMDGVYADRANMEYRTAPPPNGIIIFRLSESISFLNAEYFKGKVLNAVYITTDSPVELPSSWADRVWSDDRESRITRMRNNFETILPIATSSDNSKVIEGSGVSEKIQIDKFNYPHLRSVILECSGVNHIDSTGIQALIDLKTLLIEYSGNPMFELHFVGLQPKVLSRLDHSGLTRLPTDPPGKSHRYVHLTIQQAVISADKIPEHHESPHINIV
ncbi:hypothetical protein K7432_012282 [Basidiobolus ranarum]|uniref:STAS domain-containing protein n=1 Tax=Basidiobolus ranarum TaxID=34480 RepID=A0ABR2VSI3_9FUNG